MARRTVKVLEVKCDICGAELEKPGSPVQVKYGTSQQVELDLCSDHEKQLMKEFLAHGRQTKRRGRKPGSVTRRSRGKNA
ncbi:MAG: hypothetical protein WDA71_00020 [Actinomycetota bacterium]